MDGLGLAAVEVGHGNGVGASSQQLGFSRFSDDAMLRTAKAGLRRTPLAVHTIPGFAQLDDLRLAVDCGVDLFRVAAHCTEADLTERYIEFVRGTGLVAHGVLMMSHMASPKKLLEEAEKLASYGAQAVILMDSAGAYLPRDVREKVGTLVDALTIPVGFHAHNNLGMAVANTLVAVESGATIADGTLNGFGAGAGNTPLEVLVAALHHSGADPGVNLFEFFSAAEKAAPAVSHRPIIKQSNIMGGLHGVFSGFERPIAAAAERYGVDPNQIYSELGKRKVVAGQEDLIVEVAQGIQSKNH